MLSNASAWRLISSALSTIFSVIRIAQRVTVSESVKVDQLPWDMTRHLVNQGICEAFFEVAGDHYPDLLLKVRENIARAVSRWLMEEGVRAEVRWSDADNRFAGRLKGFGDDICFHGETPAEVLQAFVESVRNQRPKRAT
jgi:hypothetical protein